MADMCHLFLASPVSHFWGAVHSACGAQSRACPERSRRTSKVLNDPCCSFGCFSFKLPQSRHPERSAARIYRVTQRLWRAVEGPRRCLLYPCCSERFDHRSWTKGSAAIRTCWSRAESAGRASVVEKGANGIDRIGTLKVPSATHRTGPSTPRRQALRHPDPIREALRSG